MVLVKLRQVIVPAPFYTDKGDFRGIELLQCHTVPYRYQPVAGAMQDIGMAIHLSYPPVGTQVIAQYIFHGEQRQKTFRHLTEAVIRRIQYKVAGLIFRCQPAGKATANAAAIQDNVMLRVLYQQCVVHKLHIAQHLFFTALAGAFSKAAVVHHHYIIIIPVKVAGIPGPALYAPRIAMKIEYKPGRFFPVKMQPVDTYARFHIKKIFPEGQVIFKLEILLQLFRLEDKPLLQEISND